MFNNNFLFQDPTSQGYGPLINQGYGPLAGLGYGGSNFPWGGGGIFGQSQYCYQQPSFAQFAPSIYQNMFGSTGAFDFGKGVYGGGLGDLLIGGAMTAVQGYGISENIKNYGTAGWINGGIQGLAMVDDFFGGIADAYQQPIRDYVNTTQQLTGLRGALVDSSQLPQYQAFRSSLETENAYAGRGKQIDQQIKELLKQPRNSATDAQIEILMRDRDDALLVAKDQRITTDSMKDAVAEEKARLRAQEKILAAQQKEQYKVAHSLNATG